MTVGVCVRSLRRRSGCRIFEMPKSSTLTSGAPVDRLREEEVLRLEVAVDDAERVRLGERLARLEDVVARASAARAAALLGR